VALFFEWDPVKARKNLEKHNVDFAEAATVLLDDLSVTYPDPDHSIDEERYVTFGVSGKGRLLVVAHADPGDNIRVISAREMTRGERHYYEENRQARDQGRASRGV
jgi:uncharacterized DUF497 family protein